MKRALKNTNIITLILIALSFNCCKNASSRSEILDFQFSYNNRQDYIEKYVSLADNVDLSHAKDPDLLEKISQIYYLNGRELYNKKDYIEAANTLTKSYLAKKSSITYSKNISNDDFHFLGQVSDALGNIYNDFNSLKAASFFYNDALEKFTNAQRQHEVIDMLLKIGDLYEHNHISNIALLNYETAEGKRNLTEEQLNTILIKKGVSLYHIQDNATADSIFNAVSSKPQNSIDYHYFASCYFYNHNDYPKAIDNLLPCFNDGSPNMKLKAAEKLAEIFFLIGEREKEFEFAQYQARVLSSEARLTPVRLQLESFFDSFSNNLMVTAKPNDTPLITAVIASLLIIIVLILILYFRKKRKDTRTQSETASLSETPSEPDGTTTESPSPTETPTHSISPTIDSASRSPMDIEISDDNIIEHRSFDEDYKAFSNSKPFLEIKNSIEGKEFFIKTVGDYPELALSKTKLIQLTTTFNSCFPNLTHTILSQYPELTSSDIRFIIFSLMQFSDLEIAVLLKQTYSSANKRANKVRGILKTDEPLYTFIPSFLRSIKY